MRKTYRMALASCMSLVLSMVIVPIVNAEHGRNGNDDASTANTATTSEQTVAGSDSSASVTADDNTRSGSQKLEDFHRQVEQLNDQAKARVDQAKNEVEQRKAESSVKPDSKQLAFCQKHEQGIDKIMQRIGVRGDNHIALIGKIADNVEAYYKAKNLSVANYDELVAAVNSTKATAQSAVDAANQAKGQFSCDGDPAGSATDFKTLVQARNDAIKSYRDAVKQLIQAVKAASPATGSAKGNQ